MRRCARCGLLSPDQSRRCECGFDFRFDDRRSVRREHAEWKSAARWRLAGGLLLVALGLGITLASYATASDQGGSYIIWYGVIISGLIMAGRAFARLRKIRDIESDAGEPKPPGAAGTE